MKKSVLLSLLFVPVVLLAGGAVDPETSRYFLQTGRETDFVPRVVNFLIFAALLYYLLSTPIKTFFTERSAGIASSLKEVEEKLQVIKDEEKVAQANLEKSVKKADEIVSDAKNEAVILAKKIAEANAQELSIMDKQLEEKMRLEERRSAREAIDEVLSQNITTEDILLDSTKVVGIVANKVEKSVADGKVA